MKYRITTQHSRSDSEQTITTTDIKEDAKRLYVNSAENDYFHYSNDVDVENGKE